MSALKPILVRLIPTLLALQWGSLRADAWSWLDDEDRQQWSGIILEGYGHEIEFAVPDKKGRFGRHVVRSHPKGRGRSVQRIVIGPEHREHPAFSAAWFVWEWQWGGFLKEDLYDYKLNVLVSYIGEGHRLLDRGIDERIQLVRKEHRDLYRSSGTPDGEKWFFERFRIEPYQSSQPYTWTVENAPTVMKEQEYFRLPLTQQHELVFWFYYRMEDRGGRGDPEWLARRQALSRTILDTVRIRPVQSEPPPPSEPPSHTPPSPPR